MNIIANLCCGPLDLFGFTHRQNLQLAFPNSLIYSFARKIIHCRFAPNPSSLPQVK